MTNVLNSKVLVLNSGWHAIGETTAKEALTSLFSQNQDYDDVAAKAMNIEYEQLGEDSFNFDNAVFYNAVELADWMKLPIRPYDQVIHTAKHTIRVPTVIVVRYAKPVMKEIKPTRKNIFKRDGYTCQYTGKKLPKSDLNIDHVLPRDRGGKDNWENLVCSSIEINTKKGNKTNDEAGLKLIRKPKKPVAVPASSLIKEIRNIDWKLFLTK